ncbi:MAG TPA: bifunctional tRNA (5-methylaminomethyl-2-thiouridine)(34)-methyltransferase MnmD/FAD-dependent 5-carboxymethylaminomethyl-2-thiouridine(34) oxidoreductase MnmC, partial [Alphaproteobacteria bacterium]|nr:bifunctional tRNA (5-methylaminomethyl-2-thiouridine)(34)-methyltransferase MnmD/FAD-dependent 5-carboxymethylaminomethyl-2-thiouridine(34) oxidoreductase MnmC [Alphaproteobacteria bacterium]
PPRWPGRHRRLLMGGRVTLDLLYGDSTQRLRESMFKADAWYLDGFSPARNPAMWQDDLYALMAERSSPGATLGSFTAAG